MKYEYRVGRESFVGGTYRYGQMSSGDDHAERIVAGLPVEKQVPVHYDPYDPADSVLLTGIEGTDLFMLLFLMPFNAVMLLGWWFVLDGLRRSIRRLPAAGVPIVRRGPRRHLRMDALGPPGTMIGAAGILAFIAIFPIAFGLGMRPSLPLITAVWIVVLGFSALAGGWQRLRLESGQGDLVVNEMDCTLLLSHTFGRREDIYVPFESVHGIEIKRAKKRENARPGTMGRCCSFTHFEGKTRREKIAEWGSREDAEEFAAWLREQLAEVPPAGSSAEAI